jgi:hypothetical protein
MAATADPRAKPPSAAPHHLAEPWAHQASPAAHRMPVVASPKAAAGGDCGSQRGHRSYRYLQRRRPAREAVAFSPLLPSHCLPPLHHTTVPVSPRPRPRRLLRHSSRHPCYLTRSPLSSAMPPTPRQCRWPRSLLANGSAADDFEPRHWAIALPALMTRPDTPLRVLRACCFSFSFSRSLLFSRG